MDFKELLYKNIKLDEASTDTPEMLDKTPTEFDWPKFEQYIEFYNYYRRLPYEIKIELQELIWDVINNGMTSDLMDELIETLSTYIDEELDDNYTQSVTDELVQNTDFNQFVDNGKDTALTEAHAKKMRRADMIKYKHKMINGIAKMKLKIEQIKRKAKDAQKFNKDKIQRALMHKRYRSQDNSYAKSYYDAVKKGLHKAATRRKY